MKLLLINVLAWCVIGSSLSMAQGKRGGGGRRPDIAPELGAKALDLKAQKLGSDEFVDLGAIKKLTVLIFGSYT